MSNFDINVDRRTDERTEKRTPISHPATGRCDIKHTRDSNLYETLLNSALTNVLPSEHSLNL